MTNVTETGQGTRNIESLQTYYQGNIVSDYEARRATQASWHKEARVLDTGDVNCKKEGVMVTPRGCEGCKPVKTIT